MDQTKVFNGAGKVFQLRFFQLLPLSLLAIDGNGIDFDRVELAGCHVGTRTIVDGFGGETVRHRTSFQTQVFKAAGVSAFDWRTAGAGWQALNKLFQACGSYAC